MIALAERPSDEPLVILKLLVENGRPITVVAPSIIVSIYYFFYVDHLNFPVLMNYFLLLFGVITLRMGINNVNNVYDLEIDKINKPHRPIPRGELNKETAFITGMIIQFFSLFVFMLISTEAFLLDLTFVIVGWLYNIDKGLKNFFPINNLIIGYVRGFGYLLAVVVARPYKPELNQPLFYNIHPIHWLFAIAVTLYIFGSINSKDINDVEGDKANNRQTLPIILGEDKKGLLGYFAAPFILAPPVIFSIITWSFDLSTYYYLVLITIPLDLTIIYFINKTSTTKLVENNVAWLLMIITYLSHHVIFAVILVLTGA